MLVEDINLQPRLGLHMENQSLHCSKKVGLILSPNMKKSPADQTMCLMLMYEY